MKLVISIIGSMASGKTTQSKKLVSAIAGDEKPVYVTGDKIWYTAYPNSGLAVLGKVAENQCCGLDSVYSLIGSDGVALTLQAALNNEDINLIVIEGAFQTMSWHRQFFQIGIRDKYKLIVAYIHLDIWHNLKRLAERKLERHNKTKKNENNQLSHWSEVYHADTVYTNVRGKNIENRNIFLKLEGTHEKQEDWMKADVALKIDGILNPDAIHKKILKLIFENL